MSVHVVVPTRNMSARHRIVDGVLSLTGSCVGAGAVLGGSLWVLFTALGLPSFYRSLGSGMTIDLFFQRTEKVSGTFFRREWFSPKGSDTFSFLSKIKSDPIFYVGD